jgi:hypothetical protein
MGRGRTRNLAAFGVRCSSWFLVWWGEKVSLPLAALPSLPCATRLLKTTNAASCIITKTFKAPRKSIAMAAGQKLYPRATVKKIVKAHSKRNVSKNVDVLVCILDASPKEAMKLTDNTDFPRLCPLPTNVRNLSLIQGTIQRPRAAFKNFGADIGN